MGPIAGTINALLFAGWKPSRPDFQKIDEGTSINLDGRLVTGFQVIGRAQTDLQQQVWTNPANHEHGKGLETGIPSFTAARRAIIHLRNNAHVSA